MSKYFAYAAGTYDITVKDARSPVAAARPRWPSRRDVTLGDGAYKTVAFVGGSAGTVGSVAASSPFTDEVTVASTAWPSAS